MFRRLRGKLSDFWYFHGEKIQAVLKIGASLLSLYVIFGLIFGWFDGVSKEDILKEEKKLKNSYVVLDKSFVGFSDMDAYKLKILLKDPFMDVDTFNKMTDYIIEKEKEDLKKKDKKLYALEIDVYTRKMVYDLDLKPVTVIYYQHKDGWTESLKKRWFFMYRNYEKKGKFLSLVKSDQYPYLNDKEYKIFLRVVELSELFGGDDISNGVRAYVEYDLRLSSDSDVYYKKMDEIKNLVNRALSYGEYTNMYKGMGAYLLEYYKEHDKNLYNYVVSGILPE